MKILPIVCIAVGALIGSGVTYFALHTQRALTSKEESAPVTSPNEPAIDPFTNEAGDMIRRDNKNSAGGAEYDLGNPAERDQIISHWYLDMQQVVSGLESRTGHSFTPVGKLHASPTTILEEQSEFLKQFQEETERLTKKRSSAGGRTED